jgi:hypothetical protein
VQQLSQKLAAQAADAAVAAVSSEERAIGAEKRLQVAVDEANKLWLQKWKSKMPLDLPEASSTFDIAPESLFCVSPCVAASMLLISELRRSFSLFSLFLNAFRDRTSAAVKGADTCIKVNGKFGNGYAVKLLFLSCKEHSKVMEAVVGSVARLVVCSAAIMGDLQSQMQHESDLLQSIMDSTSSTASALQKWSAFVYQLSVCTCMLLSDEAAEPRDGTGGNDPLLSSAVRELNRWHRSLVLLTSISREVPCFSPQFLFTTSENHFAVVLCQISKTTHNLNVNSRFVVLL